MLLTVRLVADEAWNDGSYLQGINFESPPYYNKHTFSPEQTNSLKYRQFIHLHLLFGGFTQTIILLYLLQLLFHWHYPSITINGSRLRKNISCLETGRASTTLGWKLMARQVGPHFRGLPLRSPIGLLIACDHRVSLNFDQLFGLIIDGMQGYSYIKSDE